MKNLIQKEKPYGALQFVMLMIALMFVSTLTAQVKLPETQVGKRTTEILNLFNSGDVVQAEKYVRENYAAGFRDAFPMDQHVGIFKQIHSSVGNLELYSINATSPKNIDVTFYSPSTNSLLNIHIVIEEAQPYLIESIGIRPGGQLKASEKKRENPEQEKKIDEGHSLKKHIVTDKEIKDTLDKVINEMVSKDEFSGSILIAKNGKPIYTNAVGYADKGFKVPNKLDTKFCLASMNKMFTGTAIMQLLQKGKLNLEDKVGKYLPDYPNTDVRDKVTIHQLLTHTSGMGSYWMEFFESSKLAEINTVTDYDNLANKNPLMFEPGERFSYSNCGPLVLGLIIEKITGLSYDEYILKYVTLPAGMKNTDCYDISLPIENLAVGYTDGRPLGRSFNPRRSNLFTSPVKGGPAGGGYSTVEDLLKFDIALRSHKLLDEEHFKLMTTGKVKRNETVSYAYLFQEEFVNGHRIIGHNGGAGGVNSHLSMYMDLGYTVAIMSNYDPPAAENIARKLKELLTQSAPKN